MEHFIGWLFLLALVLGLGFIPGYLIGRERLKQEERNQRLYASIKKTVNGRSYVIIRNAPKSKALLQSSRAIETQKECTDLVEQLNSSKIIVE